MGDGGLCELFVDDCDQLRHVPGADDLFSILETWEECMNGGGGGASCGAASAAALICPSSGGGGGGAEAGGRQMEHYRRREGEEEKGGGGGGGGGGGLGGAPVQKKHKGSPASSEAAENEGASKMSHITVERNRRKQMNEHLAVLRSLMPCFYVKRGDQASIIGGVVDYIKELQQVLHSLEAKKYRKTYAEQVISPRPPAASPRPFIKSTPPLSPRLPVPISPRTPTPDSPYKPCGGGTGAGRPPHHPAAAAYMSPALTPTSTSHSLELSPRAPPPPPFLPILDSIVTELAAHAACRPAAAAGARLLLPEVKVEFAGPNVVVKTVSHRSPGQALKIIAVLESLSLEILHVSISTVDGTMVHSFTIKIGIECELSAEDLVHEIQQTFL